MGTFHNIIHANEIAQERDLYKRTSAGLGLSAAGILIGALVSRHKLRMKLSALEERLNGLELANQQLMTSTPQIWTNPNGEIPTMPMAATDVAVETLTDVVPDPKSEPLDEFFEVNLDDVKEVKPEEKKSETKTTKGGKK